MAQIIETPDKRISGQIVGLLIQPDGKIQNINWAISGAANGPSITFLAQNSPSWFSSGAPISGVVNRTGELDLTGPAINGQVTALRLNRGTVGQFQTMAAQVRTRSGEIIKARENQQSAQKFLSQLKRLISGIERFGSDADKTIHDAPNAEARYRSITSKMSARLKHERDLSGNSNAFVARSQIAVEMLQGPIATDQVHFQVQSLEQSFQTNVVPMAQAISRTIAGCGAFENGKYQGPLGAEIASACQTLTSAYPAFQQRYQATAGTLARLETVYQQERKVQQSYSDEAQKIE